MDEKEDIKVVLNDDNNLEISPVYEHLNIAKPQPKENIEEIIIPEVIESNNETEKKEEQDN